MSGLRLSHFEQIKIRAALRLHLSDGEKRRNAYRVLSRHVPTDQAAQLAMEVTTDGEPPVDVSKPRSSASPEILEILEGSEPLNRVQAAKVCSAFAAKRPRTFSPDEAKRKLLEHGLSLEQADEFAKAVSHNRERLERFRPKFASLPREWRGHT